MKFIVDNALSPIIAKGLKKAGFDAVHVRDINMRSSADTIIFEYARQNDRIIVSADTDFGTLLALWKYSKPSVILFRTSDKRPQSQLALLLTHIAEIKDALVAGCIAVFEDSRIRIRTLPIG